MQRTRHDRTFHPPVIFPLSLLKRNTGPEPEMRWQIHPEWFEIHVGQLMERYGQLME